MGSLVKLWGKPEAKLRLYVGATSAGRFPHRVLPTMAHFHPFFIRTPSLNRIEARLDVALPRSHLLVQLCLMQSFAELRLGSAPDGETKLRLRLAPP
jgi:hypothetical protein